MPPKKKVKKQLSEVMEQCRAVLTFILSKPTAEPFSEPVDWEAYGLTDYPQVITNPMDLGSVETNLSNGDYSTPEEFCHDVSLVWSNAMTYNRSDSDIYKDAEKFSKMFDKKMSTVLNKSTKQTDSTKKKKKSPVEKEATKQDRIKFSQLVNQLTSEDLEQLVTNIQSVCPQALTEKEDDEIEIEINNIDSASLFNFNNFCNKCIEGKK